MRTPDPPPRTEAESERRSLLERLLVALGFATGAVAGFVVMLLPTVAVPLGLQYLPLPPIPPADRPLPWESAGAYVADTLGRRPK